MRDTRRLLVSLLLAIAWAAAQATAGPVQDELAQRASWTAPSAAQVKEQLDRWLAHQQVDQLVRFKVETLWSAELEVLPATELLERLALAVAVVDQAMRPLIDLCTGGRTSPSCPDFEFLGDEKVPPFIRYNLRLYYGRWLAQHDLYDEALTQLEGLEPSDVVDPASLLFYQGVVYHQLLKKDQCLPVLERLLQNEKEIPRRYASLAHLMKADLAPLRPDSLDEIARLMDDIRRRQQLYRSGRRVRQQEDEVLKKLDKLIEELKKQQADSASSAGPSGGNRSTQPLPDSVPAGGKGEGNVDPKKIGSGSNWGDLPAKERQAALQDLSKDLPAHYREVIEEYFRKLARDEPK